MLKGSLPVLFLALTSAACEVQWGGGRLALEDPSPPEPEPAEDEGEAPPPPLPDPPLLYLARLQPDGEGWLTPIARLAADSLAPLGFPKPIADEFRERFAAAFLSPGREMVLVASGRRIGSIVIGDLVADRADCAPVAAIQAILPPGASLPRLGFVLPLELAPARIGRVSDRRASNRMITFGPVLAEQLLRAEGVARPFLAQRMAMDAVAAQDTVLEMAATYLINDSLKASPPLGDAASLFFLARREPTRGYIPVWREIRTYDTAEEKEAFAYVEWIELDGSRFDFVNSFGGSGERLAASRAPADWRDRLSLAERRFDWREPPECPALGLLEEVASR